MDIRIIFQISTSVDPNKKQRGSPINSPTEKQRYNTIEILSKHLTQSQ